MKHGTLQPNIDANKNNETDPHKYRPEFVKTSKHNILSHKYK